METLLLHESITKQKILLFEIFSFLCADAGCFKAQLTAERHLLLMTEPSYPSYLAT